MGAPLAQAGATSLLPTAQRAKAASTPVVSLHHARDLLRRRPHQPLRRRRQQAEVAASSDQIAVIVVSTATAGATCLLPIATHAKAVSIPVPALHHALGPTRHRLGQL